MQEGLHNIKNTGDTGYFLGIGFGKSEEACFQIYFNIYFYKSLVGCGSILWIDALYDNKLTWIHFTASKSVDTF